MVPKFVVCCAFIIFEFLQFYNVLCRFSLVAQMVKHLPTMRETGVQSLGQEATLEEGMETNSSILAWEIPWTEEPGGLRSIGSQKVRHD